MSLQKYFLNAKILLKCARFSFDLLYIQKRLRIVCWLTFSPMCIGGKNFSNLKDEKANVKESYEYFLHPLLRTHIILSHQRIRNSNYNIMIILRLSQK